MGAYQVSTSEVIPAPPARVYAILKDYRQEHPAILPKQFFKKLTVLEGGNGEGTVFEAEMNVFGAKSTVRMRVREPEPGRVLVEEDPSTGMVTTFMVERLHDGEQAHVTISTHAQTSTGIKGLIERLASPPIMRHIYRAELKNLAAYI